MITAPWAYIFLYSILPPLISLWSSLVSIFTRPKTPQPTFDLETGHLPAELDSFVGGPPPEIAQPGLRKRILKRLSISGRFVATRIPIPRLTRLQKLARSPRPHRSTWSWPAWNESSSPPQLPRPSFASSLGMGTSVGHIALSDMSSYYYIASPPSSPRQQSAHRPTGSLPSPGAVLDITITTEQSMYSTESYAAPMTRCLVSQAPQLLPLAQDEEDVDVYSACPVDQETSRYKSPLEMLTSMSLLGYENISIDALPPTPSNTPLEPSIADDIEFQSIHDARTDESTPMVRDSGPFWFMDPGVRQNFDITNTCDNLASLAVACQASPDVVSAIRHALKTTVDDGKSPRVLFEQQSQWQSVTSLATLSSPDKENRPKRPASVSLSRGASKISRAHSKRSQRLIYSGAPAPASTKLPYLRDSTHSAFPSVKSEWSMGDRSVKVPASDSAISMSWSDIALDSSLDPSNASEIHRRKSNSKRRGMIMSSPYERPSNPTPVAAKTRDAKASHRDSSVMDDIVEMYLW